MPTINMLEAKSSLSRLVEAVESGRETEIIIAGITTAHIHSVASLPPSHNDPFDGLLIAQAKETRLHLLTHDRVMPRYGDHVLRV